MKLTQKDKENIEHLLNDNKRACQTNKTFADELEKGIGNLLPHERKAFIKQYRGLVVFHKGIIKTLEKVWGAAE